MKKVISISLTLVFVLLVFTGCSGGSKKELTVDDCLGVWVLESGTGFTLNYSIDNPEYCQKFEVVKAGLVKGYKEKDGTTYSEYQWTIEDDAFKISWEAMAGGTSIGNTFVFEVDGDTMTAIDGGNSVYKKQ